MSTAKRPGVEPRSNERRAPRTWAQIADEFDDDASPELIRKRYSLAMQQISEELGLNQLSDASDVHIIGLETGWTRARDRIATGPIYRQKVNDITCPTCYQSERVNGFGPFIVPVVTRLMDLWRC